MVQNISGYDANSLYPACMDEVMPCGPFFIREAPNFERQYQTGLQYSRAAVNWLERVAQQKNIFIAHAENGPEMKLGSRAYRVDGYCEETKTAYLYRLTDKFPLDIFTPEIFTPDIFTPDIFTPYHSGGHISTRIYLHRRFFHPGIFPRGHISTGYISTGDFSTLLLS